MGYEQVLETLKEQAKKCKTREEYLKKQEEIALSTKEISLLIGVGIANVSNKIRRLIIEDKIKVLEGFFKNKDRTETNRGCNNKKYYALKVDVCLEEKLWK